MAPQNADMLIGSNGSVRLPHFLNLHYSLGVCLLRPLYWPFCVDFFDKITVGTLIRYLKKITKLSYKCKQSQQQSRKDE